jgi:hypothetical protein
MQRLISAGRLTSKKCPTPSIRSPPTLACMHVSAWRGDGSKLLLELAEAFVEITEP